MPIRLSQGQLLEKYGHPQSIMARRSMRRLTLKWTDPGSPIAGIATQAHKSVATPFYETYQEVCRKLDEWPTEVEGLNVRKIAGTQKWSLHAWALAWDVFNENSSRIDPKTGRRIPSVAWFDEWQTRGWFAGQNFRHPDPHHLEWPW